jgi:hypothetical protein
VRAMIMAVDASPADRLSGRSRARAARVGGGVSPGRQVDFAGHQDGVEMGLTWGRSGANVGPTTT